MLGISQAGKTTLLTQMRLIYADGYDSSERIDFLPILISNLLDGFKSILGEASEPMTEARSEIVSRLNLSL